MKRIRVKLKNSPYNVIIEEGLLRQSGAQVLEAMGKAPSLTLVVTSPRVRKLWGQTLEVSLCKSRMNFAVVEMDDGEREKDFGTLKRLLKRFVECKADRGSLVIAFGGGVVGDVAAFAASIYMRGIPVIQVPTTLQAQVDAAVGGKTGVNLGSAKNLIGTFHQPRVVLIDPQVLGTLPDREFRAALFEAVKSAIIRDPKLFEFLEDKAPAILKRNASVLMRVISASVKVKAKVVVADEREGDLRRILNFGHTIGHALEAESGFKRFAHGEAVAWGMIAAANIGVSCGITPLRVARRIGALIEKFGPLPRVTANADKILKLIQSDKKTLGGVPHFVLVREIGTVEVVNKVTPEMVKKAMASLRRKSHSAGASGARP